MKKMLVWVLFLSMLFSAVSAFAEGEALTIDQLDGMECIFSSGAGGWATELHFGENGAFTGDFHDSEMGEADEAYPNGTVYVCGFSGQMSLVGQADEYAWTLRVDSLTLDDETGKESIDDDMRFVTTDPYGISEGDELLVYLPGTPVSVLNEDQRMWAHLLGDEAPEALENWFLYSAANESGFVGYFMDDATLANPWVDMTADELAQVSGVTLNLPEGAQDAVYRWLESESLAELQFTLDGDEYCARVKPDALEAGQLDNISGMYFEWEHEEEITVGHCPGTIGLAQTGSSDYTELCLWYDVAPGLMYSLSVYTTEPDGLDLTAVAAMVYEPMQGEA